MLFEIGELLIRGPKIMAPLADTMSLVDGDAGKFTMRVHGGEVLAEGVRETHLRRDVEETVMRVAAFEVIYYGRFDAVRGLRIEGCHLKASQLESRDLVVHES